MKATLALIPDLTTLNEVMALSWNLHLRHGTGVEVRKLPPHVSLKQPFEAPEITDLLGFVERFAGSVSPIDILFSTGRPYGRGLLLPTRRPACWC
jgi:hypothetical protein